MEIMRRGGYAEGIRNEWEGNDDRKLIEERGQWVKIKGRC